MATSKQKQTVVEEGTALSGTLKSKGGVVVHGTFDGSVEAGELNISPTGVVDGSVLVDRLISEGTLAGTIVATRIQLAGEVRDQTHIEAQDLEVRLEQAGDGRNARFGSCVLEVGEDPLAPATTNIPKDNGAASPDSAGPGATSPGAAVLVAGSVEVSGVPEEVGPEALADQGHPVSSLGGETSTPANEPESPAS